MKFTCAVRWMAVAGVALFAAAGDARAWVSEAEVRGELAGVRTAYREEYRKAVEPVHARALQQIRSHAATAKMRRDIRTGDLLREIERLLVLTGSLDTESVKAAAAGRPPREIELLCANFETEKNRIGTLMAPRYLAELKRIEAATADAADLAVLARERRDIEAGDHGAWSGVSRLARELQCSRWDVPAARASVVFLADGTIDGQVGGTWQQVGENSLRARFKAPRSYLNGQEALLTFSVDRTGFAGHTSGATPYPISGRRVSGGQP